MRLHASFRPRIDFLSAAVIVLVLVPNWMQLALGDEKPNPKRKTSLRLDDEQPVELTATMSPIEFTRYGFHERWDELRELTAAQPRKKYTGNAFRAFLPSQAVEVGSTWKIKEDVIQIIRQLHATSTLDLHASDAEGGWAILVANGERFAEIKFRIHADFPLKQGYLTFSQFAGRLVIDHVNQKIVLFRIFVPDNTINFDTKWKTSPTARGHITDAGRCRHVELVSGHDSVVDAIQWDERLSADKAELVLARKFYPAWKIDWQPIGKAHELAKQLNKPIHIVSADGPFKDEAC